MSLPPERITVKRRRDEEPIEALYIRQKKYRPSAVWKLAGNENDEPAYVQPPAPSTSSEEAPFAFSRSPQVPLVRTTVPSEDVLEVPQDTPSDPQMKSFSERNPAPTGITRPVRKGQNLQESAHQPRTFHLAKSSLKAFTPYSVYKASTQRNVKNKGSQLAVFVEAAKPAKEMPICEDRFHNIKETAECRSQGDDQITESHRKRPNATATERKWRAETWDKSTKSRQPAEKGTRMTSQTSQPSQNWNYESPELAVQLQKTALEEMRIQEEHPKKCNTNQQLKIKPQPPRPRRPLTNASSHEEGEDDEMTDAVALNDDTEFVFDTYVRSNAHPHKNVGASDHVTDLLQHIDQSKTGILLIGDGEEEVLWETFGEEVNNDTDWNSEEEDENAEDFYGNDYPEDEVNSNDEFDRGAYNFRHVTSDDDEFSVEEPHWSDSDEATSF